MAVTAGEAEREVPPGATGEPGEATEATVGRAVAGGASAVEDLWVDGLAAEATAG